MCASVSLLLEQGLRWPELRYTTTAESIKKTEMLLVQLRPKLKLVLLYSGHFVTNDWLRNVSLTLNERIDDKCCAEHCGSGRKIRFDSIRFDSIV